VKKGKVKSQSHAEYPFHPLPGPPHRPVLGTVLIGLGWAIPLLIGVSYLLIFFRYWNPVVFGGDASNSTAIFLALFSLIMLVFVVRPLCANLVARGQALSQVDAMTVLATHPNPPILYLRSFKDDPLVDTTTNPPTGFIPVAPTYERRLSRLFRRLGPVICIGRPGENLPEIGAARFYVSDDEWQAAIGYFLPRAAAVILMVGSTEGLLWEIQNALYETPWEKLLFFFPYVYPIERSRRWWYRFSLGTNLYFLQISGSKPQQEMVLARDERFALFRSKVQDLVPHPLPTSLGNASFLTFSPEGEPQLLKTRRPPSGRSMFNPMLRSEIDLAWTLFPFMDRLSVGGLPLPFQARAAQHRSLLERIVLLSILSIFSGCVILTFLRVWYGFILFFGGTLLINVAIYYLRVATINQDQDKS
jgi:hypothetical protein